jgi:aldehyde dehydrogenase
MAQYQAPGQTDSLVSVQSRYGNFIGGEWVPPVSGKYFENITPVTGQPFTEIARSTGDDINLALDAAHGARQSWGGRRPASAR